MDTVGAYDARFYVDHSALMQLWHFLFKILGICPQFVRYLRMTKKTFKKIITNTHYKIAKPNGCLSSSSAERLPNKATVKGGDTPTTLAGCKSVCHKSDENSRAGLPLALSSCTTGVPASCEDDTCRHPAGSPAPVASPSPNTTIGDRTSQYLFHTLEDPHTASISSTDRLQLPAFPSP
ncbi:hypothetical protein PoB_001794500 [Plakobranchus ocellatus]|uniref:Uncharacterized protein n=1 Tax=Plakobranchus ocellatus TaxID=259542 RepID=A0AAV3Z8G4_9GAST|nr:hypothetical protein PoB_001794500 [Plakobranchus ocellatus]